MKKRILVLMFTFIFAFVACAGRILYITKASAFKVADSYNSYTLTIDTALPNIYYRDLSRLTNNKFKRVAVIRPVERDVMEAAGLFYGKKKESVLEGLREGKPVVTDVDMNFKSKSIETYTVKRSENYCRHIISEECSGLLMHIPEEGEKLKVNLLVDANGRFLSGDRGSIVNNGYYGYEGIALTLDKKIQSIAYNASYKLKSGCVVIMDVKTSEILACVIKPYSDYLNKAFTQYSVGSVFKTVVAACALENNIIFDFECKGKTRIGDTVFACQKEKKHGNQNLKAALANSCNCYFAHLALKLGANKIIDTAKSLGFDSYTEIYNGWNIKNSSLPDYSLLSNAGNIAQLGFGQGSLTASPLQICSLMCTVANGGVLNKPSLAFGTVDEKMKLIVNKKEKGTRALGKSTVDTLLNYLRNVVENGTGREADNNNKSAGKTATAQTGQYKNGKEILNTWFAGVYPYGNPEYAVVVMCDNGTSGAENCCPIFRTIVEMLNDL